MTIIYTKDKCKKARYKDAYSFKINSNWSRCLIIYFGIKLINDANNGDSFFGWILAWGVGPAIILGGGILIIFMIYHLIAFCNEPADYSGADDKPRKHSSSRSNSSSASNSNPQRVRHLKNPGDE